MLKNNNRHRNMECNKTLKYIDLIWTKRTTNAPDKNIFLNTIITNKK